MSYERTTYKFKVKHQVQ